MKRLEIIIIITGVVFILFAIDLYQRKKFNLLHFLVFGGGTWLIMYFALIPEALDRFGNIFGLARGADLIVYLAIIFLAYGYISLLNSLTRRDEERTQLARSLALHTAIWDISGQQIIFIIPSYGENQTVIDTVSGVIQAWYKAIIVDDGNNTVNFMQDLSDHIKNNQIVLVTHPLNLGQWAALQTGAQRVQKYSPTTQLIVHFDADGQHQVDDLSKFIHAFESNPNLDIVMWSRFLGTTTDMGRFRTIHKKLQVLFMKMFVWLDLTDTNNGYRVIKTSALDKLKITSNRMAHASQLENLIKDHNLTYQEVPVTIAYTEYSKQKWQKLTNMFSILGELFYKWWFYK